MTFDSFITKYSGKYIDFDFYFGYQCMDLYRQYVKEVLECPQSKPVSGARLVWTNYRTDYFDRIPNGPNNFPDKGDIVIWDRPAGAGYGHIAIAYKADSMRFTSFDQNWGPNLQCHLQPHNYTNILGWLRFKKKR